MKRAYVGNIPFAAGEDEIKKFFFPYKLVAIEIIIDKATNRPRGFAFVDFDTEAEFERALVTHHGREIDGRRIVVNDATEKRAPRTAVRGRK